ncbi:MAG: hypothetical protein WKF43_10110 [Acidimicrobiales bacterium]
MRPTEVLAQSLADLGGGPTGEALLLAVMMAVLLLLAAYGRPGAGGHVDLGARLRPEVRPLLFLVAVTLLISQVVGYATTSTFATRYLAILVPLVLAVAGLGLTRLTSGVGWRVVIGAVLVLGTIGGLRNVVNDRTQAEVAAEAIIAGGGRDDLVVLCPDQLGPSLSRVLPDRFEVVTYPRFEAPERVDWVDYTDRLAEADPEDFARQALRRAGDRPSMWWAGTTNHEGTCERVLTTLAAGRPGFTNPVLDDGGDFFEHAGLYELPPPPPTSGGG